MQFSPNKKIYIIVGEESGENIATSIVSSLKEYSNFKLYGIGGSKLKKFGLKSLFPFTELSIMGLIEIIPKVPKILFLINKTVKHILKISPDLIITVDSPDFCFRVLKKVRNINPSLKTLHIVAPTVWAWKPSRAKKISYFVDNLFVLFPFEKKYFIPYGIKTKFIGHPFLEKTNFEVKSTKKLINFKNKIISIFPGSRKNEILRHLDQILLYLTMNDYSKKYTFIIISIDRYKELVESKVNKYLHILNIHVLSSSKYKNYAFKYSDYAIAVSGTISLELALCKIPLIVVYRLNFLSFFLIKRLVRVKYISLPNIILNKRIIIELIQRDFCYKNFNIEFNNLINNQKIRDKQIMMFEKLIGLLDFKSKSRKSVAIKTILDLIS
ncbi:MAG: Lipid-A-disaccharide synthase [Alphaproteobacteria bacterium MarineAlpha9_Bin4]|nr:lipid-A-disaccharide synthase [Pelagibacterales bacterium]PPR27556.1 MAG: Lipid-A-disaccharide synthase [Alphaproteobacteria bacterium MarineAlpha9_Bin4]